MTSYNTSGATFKPHEAPRLADEDSVWSVICRGDVKTLDYYLCRPLLGENPAFGDPETEGSNPHSQEAIQRVLDSMKGEKMDQMCGKVFGEGDIVYICKDCGFDPTCVQCQECFHRSDHEGHDVYFHKSHGGGCCDCGDLEAWREEGCCNLHRPGAAAANVSNPFGTFPDGYLQRCVRIFSLVATHISSCMQHYKSSYDVDKVLSEAGKEDTLALVIHNDDVHTYDDVIKIFKDAGQLGPARAQELTERVDKRGEAALLEGKKKDVKSGIDKAKKSGLLISAETESLRREVNCCKSLIQWLRIRSSEALGFCLLIRHVMFNMGVPAETADIVKLWDDQKPQLSMENGLESAPVVLWMQLDAWLYKEIRTSLHDWYMSEIKNPVFRARLGLSFSSALPAVIEDYSNSVGVEEDNILDFAVHLFTVPSVTSQLVGERPLGIDLLEILLTGIRTCLSKTARIDAAKAVDMTSSNDEKLYDLAPFIDLQQRASGQEGTGNWEKRLVDANHTAIEFQRYGPITRALNYVSRSTTAPRFLLASHEHLELVFQILTILHGVNPRKKKQGDHVEHEATTWEKGFNTVINICGALEQVLVEFINKHVAMCSPATCERVVEKNLLWIYRRIQVVTHKCQAPFWGSVPYEDSKLINHKEENSTPNKMPMFSYRIDQHAMTWHHTLHRFLGRFISLLHRDTVRVEQPSVAVTTLEHVRQVLKSFEPLGDRGMRPWTLVLIPPLRTRGMSMEVLVGDWRRNGNSVLIEAINYFSPPLCTSLADDDLACMQLGAYLACSNIQQKDVNEGCIVFDEIDEVLCHMLWHFGCLNYLTNSIFFSETAYSTAASKEKMHQRAIEALRFCSIMITELPYQVQEEELPPKILDTLHSSNAKLSIADVITIRRELVHQLLVSPKRRSKLSKSAASVLHRSDFVDDDVLSALLSDIAEFREGATLDSGSYHLKDSCYFEFDYFFHHLVGQERERAHQNWIEKWRKQSGRDVQAVLALKVPAIEAHDERSQGIRRLSASKRSLVGKALTEARKICPLLPRTNENMQLVRRLLFCRTSLLMVQTILHDVFVATGESQKGVQKSSGQYQSVLKERKDENFLQSILHWLTAAVSEGHNVSQNEDRIISADAAAFLEQLAVGEPVSNFDGQGKYQLRSVVFYLSEVVYEEHFSSEIREACLWILDSLRQVSGNLRIVVDSCLGVDELCQSLEPENEDSGDVSKRSARDKRMRKAQNAALKKFKGTQKGVADALFGDEDAGVDHHYVYRDYFSELSGVDGIATPSLDYQMILEETDSEYIKHMQEKTLNLANDVVRNLYIEEHESSLMGNQLFSSIRSKYGLLFSAFFSTPLTSIAAMYQQGESDTKRLELAARSSLLGSGTDVVPHLARASTLHTMPSANPNDESQECILCREPIDETLSFVSCVRPSLVDSSCRRKGGLRHCRYGVGIQQEHDNPGVLSVSTLLKQFSGNKFTLALETTDGNSFNADVDVDELRQGAMGSEQVAAARRQLLGLLSGASEGSRGTTEGSARTQTQQSGEEVLLEALNHGRFDDDDMEGSAVDPDEARVLDDFEGVVEGADQGQISQLQLLRYLVEASQHRSRTSGNTSRDDDSLLYSLTNESGKTLLAARSSFELNVQFCTHAIHESCFEKQQNAAIQRANTNFFFERSLNVDLNGGEYDCPLCRTFSNGLVPLCSGIPLIRCDLALRQIHFMGHLENKIASILRKCSTEGCFPTRADLQNFATTLGRFFMACMAASADGKQPVLNKLIKLLYAVKPLYNSFDGTSIEVDFIERLCCVSEEIVSSSGTDSGFVRYLRCLPREFWKLECQYHDALDNYNSWDLKTLSRAQTELNNYSEELKQLSPESAQESDLVDKEKEHVEALKSKLEYMISECELQDSRRQKDLQNMYQFGISVEDSMTKNKWLKRIGSIHNREDSQSEQADDGAANVRPFIRSFLAVVHSLSGTLKSALLSRSGTIKCLKQSEQLRSLFVCSRGLLEEQASFKRILRSCMVGLTDYHLTGISVGPTMEVFLKQLSYNAHYSKMFGRESISETLSHAFYFLYVDSGCYDDLALRYTCCRLNDDEALATEIDLLPLELVKFLGWNYFDSDLVWSKAEGGITHEGGERFKLSVQHMDPFRMLLLLAASLSHLEDFLHYCCVLYLHAIVNETLSSYQDQKWSLAGDVGRSLAYNFHESVSTPLEAETFYEAAVVLSCVLFGELHGDSDELDEESFSFENVAKQYAYPLFSLRSFILEQSSSDETTSTTVSRTLERLLLQRIHSNSTPTANPLMCLTHALKNMTALSASMDERDSKRGRTEREPQTSVNRQSQQMTIRTQDVLPCCRAWQKQWALHMRPSAFAPLIELPRVFEDLFQRIVNTPSTYWKAFREQFKSNENSQDEEKKKDIPPEPLLCLVTGNIVPSGRQTHINRVGMATRYTRAVLGGEGLFLNANSSAVILIRDKWATNFPSPYVDKHGEPDVGLRRGRPLRLDSSRYERLQRLWLENQVGKEVVRRRNAASSVISQGYF
eukprot:gb/GECG01005155.1/.p1 GENE.gb/GECG01005155.1/~~gb/GECG01005155.1/.p1  ORF type:complete len:2519 (+),score=306.53 gb/GECG01005155.1/:1-7557(+)